MQTMPLIDAFIDLRCFLMIAHHIPGRLRLKASMKVAASGHTLDGKAIEAFLLSVPGVQSVRLNKMSGSAVITYDKGRIEPDYWRFLLTGEDQTVRDALEDQFISS